LGLVGQSLRLVARPLDGRATRLEMESGIVGAQRRVLALAPRLVGTGMISVGTTEGFVTGALGA
jgi:hypothetical protein